MGFLYNSACSKAWPVPFQYAASVFRSTRLNVIMYGHTVKCGVKCLNYGNCLVLPSLTARFCWFLDLTVCSGTWWYSSALHTSICSTDRNNSSKELANVEPIINFIFVDLLHRDQGMKLLAMTELVNNNVRNWLPHQHTSWAVEKCVEGDLCPFSSADCHTSLMKGRSVMWIALFIAIKAR